MSITTISPKQLHDAVVAGKAVELIDVRTPVEFREVHVSFARNVPLHQLDVAKVTSGRSAESQPLYVICKSGGRGKQACEKILAAGFTNVINVEGGTQAWDQAGLPVVRGQQAMSLERQVRIAAGSLVVLGSVLAAFVSPYWIGLAAFVGAGLVFAGVTDTCGMGMLLARMPWNKVSGASNVSNAACRIGSFLLGILILAPGMTFAAGHTADSLPTVKRGLAEKKAVLVDVREKEEWDDGHLSDALFLPLSALAKGVSNNDLASVLPKGKVIYLHCAAGGRCLKAATLLKKQGYDARPLKPGYADLIKAGFSAAAVGQ